MCHHILSPTSVTKWTPGLLGEDPGVEACVVCEKPQEEKFRGNKLVRSCQITFKPLTPFLTQVLKIFILKLPLYLN